MDKGQASLMSEETLWQLYRRLLAAAMLGERLAALRSAWRHGSAAAPVAAALSEILQQGDTLGLAARDLTTRYLCGVPLLALREAALGPSLTAKRGMVKGRWPLNIDAEHALLPCAGAEQASLAAGTALSARLHSSGALTVLVQGSTGARPAAQEERTPLQAWASAADLAVTFQLPILFITDTSAGLSSPNHQRGRRASPLPAIPVDRQDTVALYRVMYESAARARTGGGPTWIDCRSSGPIFPADRKPASAVNALSRAEEALRSRKMFTRERHRHLQQALEREFTAAGWPRENSV